jgi:hypothetical protein
MTHISSIIDINRFGLLTFIIPPIMGSQDSNLISNSSLLSSYRILKRSCHFCDNINIFQCIKGVYWKQCSWFVFIKDCLPSFVKMAEMGVAYLEINKFPCLHEIDIPKCINVYLIYRTELGMIGFFVLSFLICF